MVSTENVRKLMEMAQDASGCDDDGAGQAYADTAYCLKELLAYREGYDPRERLPEEGRNVLVDLGRGGQELIAALSPTRLWWFVIGLPGAQKFEEVRRWWPLPGGE